VPWQIGLFCSESSSLLTKYQYPHKAASILHLIQLVGGLAQAGSDLQNYFCQHATLQKRHCHGAGLHHAKLSMSQACKPICCTVHALLFQTLFLCACHMLHNTTAARPATCLSSVLHMFNNRSAMLLNCCIRVCTNHDKPVSSQQWRNMCHLPLLHLCQYNRAGHTPSAYAPQMMASLRRGMNSTHTIPITLHTRWCIRQDIPHDKIVSGLNRINSISLFLPN
jgi:hypothetical protein